MSSRASRCFFRVDNNETALLDKFRLAVMDDNDGLISSLWTVWPANNASKPDFYATCTGMHGSHKFSFHNDIVNNSFLSHAHHRLIAAGTIPDRSRHMTQTPIPELPWFAMRVRFAEASLKKKAVARQETKGPIIALPRPKEGHLLELGFLLCNNAQLEIQDIDFIIGHMDSGGRSLVLVGREVAHDRAAYLADIDRHLGLISVPDHQLEGMPEEADLSAHLYGAGTKEEIIVTEIHNVRRRSRPAA